MEGEADIRLMRVPVIRNLSNSIVFFNSVLLISNISDYFTIIITYFTNFVNIIVEFIIIVSAMVFFYRFKRIKLGLREYEYKRTVRIKG